MPKRVVLIPFKKRAHDHKRCIDAALSEAAAMCKREGLRFTTLRRRVLELVWRRHVPVKAYDVLDKLRHEGRNAAPPTVYRTLDFLIQAGLVHRIESLNAYVGCGGPGTPHVGQFLICRRCRAVAEIDAPVIANALNNAARRAGFAAEGQTVEIKGLCSECGGAAIF
ncbi:MAG: Fur family transcriptional regulator [Acidiferrobacterales bacterium]